MPHEVYLQFQMQALELKPTDLWSFLALPAEFIDGWFLVAGVIAEYKAEMMESG